MFLVIIHLNLTTLSSQISGIANVMSVTILRQSTRIGDPLPVKEYPGQINKSACFQQLLFIYVTDDKNRLPAIAGTRGDAVMPAGAGSCGERVLMPSINLETEILLFDFTKPKSASYSIHVYVKSQRTTTES